MERGGKGIPEWETDSAYYLFSSLDQANVLSPWRMLDGTAPSQRISLLSRARKFSKKNFFIQLHQRSKKCNRRVVRSVYFCWADYKRDSILYLNVSLFLLLTIGESSIIVFEWCIYLKFVDGILGGISGLERDRTIGNQC